MQKNAFEYYAVLSCLLFVRILIDSLVENT